MRTAIVLPARDEEKSVGATIRQIRSHCRFASTIYVVDGLSQDRTVARARAAGARVLLVRTPGKGAAIREAFSRIEADRLVLMDSDLSYDAADIPALLRQLDRAPIASASRFSGVIEPGAMRPINRVGNRLLTAWGNLLFSRHSSDLCTGLWAFRKSAYKSLALDAPHFELEANFFAQAAARGLPIAEIPAHYRRRYGRSKLSVRDGLSIGLYLLRARLRPRPAPPRRAPASTPTRPRPGASA